jgi:hypothetical protein
MTSQKSDSSLDLQAQGPSAPDTGQEEPEPELGCGCMMRGPGGRLRLALLIVGAVVIIGLIAYGFATAG